MTRSKSGLTPKERLLLSILIIVIAGAVIGAIAHMFVYSTICRGNFWFTEAGVLREIQADHPDVQKIVRVDHNIWSDSRIEVETIAGDRVWYDLDTNVLFDYELSVDTEAASD